MKKKKSVYFSLAGRMNTRLNEQDSMQTGRLNFFTRCYLMALIRGKKTAWNSHLPLVIWDKDKNKWYHINLFLCFSSLAGRKSNL